MSHLPEWFKQKISAGADIGKVLEVLGELRLNSVCESAICPNRAHCYGNGQATFMILGDTCTRDCSFCAVTKGRPEPVEASEPERIGLAVAELGLKYAVITSVTRDDLPDGGASQFAKTVSQIRATTPDTIVELLIPDFQGKKDSLRIVIDTVPDVIGHNLETVDTLYPLVRPQASYERSIELLRTVKLASPEILTKSGLMLGLGETRSELEETFADLQQAGCDILTLGQYLQPYGEHVPVAEYITPEKFMEYRTVALGYGFRAVASAPLVRSSYDAEGIPHPQCPSWTISLGPV